MLSGEQFFSFLLAASVLTVAPGPDNMMVLSLGMAKGRAAGIVFGLGCALGCLIHTLLAVVGVSALVAASTEAFTVLKICGGLYLIVLGLSALRHSAGERIHETGSNIQSPWKWFLQGTIANAINPKVILFFLSFLPQFVLPANGDVSAQMAALGLLFTLQAALIFGLLGFFAGTVGQWIIARPHIAVVVTRVAGTLFVGLGLRLLVSR